MYDIPSRTWNPARQWADPLIATLALLIFMLVGGQAKLRQQRVARPDTQVSLQGRLQDLALSAPGVLGPLLGKPAPHRPVPKALAAGLSNPWDKAILAIQAGEDGDRIQGAELAKAPAGALGPLFGRTWAYAYDGQGQPPASSELSQLRRPLGDGYSARLLEMRVLARSGQSIQALEKEARQWFLPRLAALAGAVCGGVLLGLAGLGFGLFLALAKAAPRTLPSYDMSGRALLIVMLGWFLCLLAAGPVVGTVLVMAPFLRPIALPLVYGFHASLGLLFLTAAEGVPLRILWQRLNPGRAGRALGMGLGFFALAFAAVMAVAMALSPLLRNAEPPQKELLELLSNLKGPLVLTLVFLTVAVVAPVFEEFLFRGFLLPWLGQRLERRLGARWGWLLALTVTGITFAAIHMQPLGLPTLSTLGIVLGLAFVRTGNLGTAILVHGLWNGSVFILMRMIS